MPVRLILSRKRSLSRRINLRCSRGSSCATPAILARSLNGLFRSHATTKARSIRLCVAFTRSFPIPGWSLVSPGVCARALSVDTTASSASWRTVECRNWSMTFRRADWTIQVRRPDFVRSNLSGCKTYSASASRTACSRSTEPPVVPSMRDTRIKRRSTSSSVASAWPASRRSCSASSRSRSSAPVLWSRTRTRSGAQAIEKPSHAGVRVASLSAQPRQGRQKCSGGDIPDTELANHRSQSPFATRQLVPPTVLGGKRPDRLTAVG
jgi:hypothetical protein